MLTKTIIENVLILVGESFWVVSTLAQLNHLLRTKNKSGLSAVYQTINAAGNVAWATYFATNRLWFPFATNLILLFLTITLLGYTLTNKKQFTKGLVTIIVVGPLTSAILIKFPATSGWLGVTYNVVSTLPWLRHIIKTKKTSGISIHSLASDYFAMFCTLSYAVLIASAPLISGCVIGIFTTVIITRYYLRYRYNK